MKNLLAIWMIVMSTFVWAAANPAAPPPAPTVVKGQILEVQDVESYSYLRLKTADGETWAAVPKAAFKKGDQVTIENVMVMTNFESKSLKKTFPKILFGSLGGGAAKPAAAGQMTAMHSGAAKAMDTEVIKVPKASGANAQTVAEVMTKSAALKDKTVVVRGKVVKYSPEIMGKNWIHLRDGSGSAENNTNDLLVTSASQTKVGAIVTIKGVVRTDKDFGAGYAYKVLIDEATLQP